MWLFLYERKEHFFEENRNDKIDIHLKKENKKGIAVNGIPIKKLGDLFGICHAVIFSPEDLELIKEGPTQRRRFMDMEICQMNTVYYYNLQQYYRILKQRNHLLKEIQKKSALKDTLFVWDEQLIDMGKRIIASRKEFLEKLNEIASQKQKQLTGGKDELKIEYKPNSLENQLEEKIKRNLQREDFRIVPPSSIERVYTAFKKEKIPSSFRIIKPEDFETITKTTPRDLNNYENIHIIGDIHGSYTALKTYFNKYPVIPQDFYIFVGDYFDRSIENYQTFKYLKELMEHKNMIFLVGNHEDKLYKYACDDEFKMDYDIKNTIEEFEQKELKKSEIRGFIKKLSQLAYITFNGKSYLITHGGIPYIPEKPLDFYSTNTFIYGIDKYDVDIDKIYNEYKEMVKVINDLMEGRHE